VHNGRFFEKCAKVYGFLQLGPEMDPPDWQTGAELGLFSSGIFDSLIGYSQPGAKNSLPKTGGSLTRHHPTHLP
jgi:hypothetical protein